MLMHKNVNNDISKNLPIGFGYFFSVVLIKLNVSEKGLFTFHYYFINNYYYNNNILLFIVFSSLHA